MRNTQRKLLENQYEQVATISANNDQKRVRAELIAMLLKLLKMKQGIVMMETHDLPETIIEVVDGAQYDKGFQNAHFITNKKEV